MTYKDNLAKAKELKKELDGYRPLTPEIEKRIMQKFRLDWNYNSSHIEGNTLTYRETKALILFGHTAQAKPLKDHLEMSGHDEAIKNIEDVVKQERPLTENFIRELHILILKEPYEVDAITADGKPTKKRISIGTYKTTPNHVKTVTGEIFYFASPEETPAKMQELMDWLSERNQAKDLDPVLLATEYHYRFIRIHPFDDGNGRIARLLMNFILMQNGYPPAIIKSEDKENYYSALQQADAGDIEYFFSYISDLVISSMELMIKGASGEDIEEEDDLDKKIALLKQKVDAEPEDTEIKVKLSVDQLRIMHKEWGYNLWVAILTQILKFNNMFINPEHSISFMLGGIGTSVQIKDKIPFDRLREVLDHDDEKHLDKAEFILDIRFGLFRKSADMPFGCNYTCKIEFDQIYYQVMIPKFAQNSKQQDLELFTKRLLHIPISKEEINNISQIVGNTLYKHLDFELSEKNKNYR
jgi:cell filamentation protein, protein adenylyltransferase